MCIGESKPYFGHVWHVFFPLVKVLCEFLAKCCSLSVSISSKASNLTKALSWNSQWCANRFHGCEYSSILKRSYVTCIQNTMHSGNLVSVRWVIRNTFFFWFQKTLKLDPNQRYLIDDCLEHEAFRTEHLLNRNQIQLRRVNTQSGSKKRKNNYTEQIQRQVQFKLLWSLGFIAGTGKHCVLNSCLILRLCKEFLYCPFIYIFFQKASSHVLRQKMILAYFGIIIKHCGLKDIQQKVKRVSIQCFLNLCVRDL